MRRVLVVLLLLLLARTTARAASTTSPSNDIDSLIQKLADPDPAVRQSASDALGQVGVKARPSLVAAARSSSPQISSRAAEILMKLPWYLPSDPPEVRRALLEYGKGGIEGRRDLIFKALVPCDGCEPALLRLAQEEPSDTVAWQAVYALRRIENPEIRAKLCKIDLTDARPQRLALSARAMFPDNPATALDIMRRLIETDSSETASDSGEMTFAYTLLVANALEQGDKAEAAKILRSRARAGGTETESADAVLSLFALYADYGATDELQDDFQEFALSIGRPEIMYALARIERRAGGSNLVADAIGQAAQASSVAEPYEHHRIAKMLMEHAWLPEAVRELYAMLACSEDPNERTKIQRQLDAHMRLAEIAEVCEEHSMCADHVQTVLDTITRLLNGRGDINDTEINAQINWHRLHAARDAGNAKAAQEFYRQLSDPPVLDGDAIIEMVQYLKSIHHVDEAKTLFEKSYKVQRAAIATSRENLRTATALNNLAWLCARCGERVDDAVAFSQRAIALEPETYAYIDTAATAQFVAGNRDEALRLEKRALLMRPNDPFIQKQLIRFEGTEARRHEGTKEE